MKDKTSLGTRTREVFHKIHLDHLSDEFIADRHAQVLDLDAMGMDEGALVGKLCADLGCGSAAHGMLNLLSLGAEKVHGLDVDKSYMASAAKRLGQNGFSEKAYELNVGSIEALPYESNTFDFVLCRGVVHHVDNDQQAVNEIYRVLKPGGRSYIFVTGRGGVLNRLFKETLREEYEQNSELQQVVSEGRLRAWLLDQIDDLKGRIKQDHTDSYVAAVTLLENLSTLIDEDLVLSLRDIVEAPKYNSYTQADFFKLLNEAGFQKYYRFGRAPNYRNVRKIFAPLYVEHDLPLARLFYHDGSINVLANK